MPLTVRLDFFQKKILFVFLAQMRRKVRRQNEKQAAESRQNSIKIKVKYICWKHLHPTIAIRIFHILFCVAHAPRIRLTADQVVFHFISGMCSFLLHFHCCHPHPYTKFNAHSLQWMETNLAACTAAHHRPFHWHCVSLLSLISFLNEIAHEVLFIYFVVVVAVVELIEPTVSAARKQFNYDLICSEFLL